MEAPIVTLEPVDYSKKSVLRNLVNLYIYDFSEMIEIPVSKDGTFECGYLDQQS